MSSEDKQREQWEQHEEISIFREYLRIPTVHPDIDYSDCVEFLKRQAASLQLRVDVVHPVLPTKPVVVMKWLGREPELRALLLNSHMDVVPVFEEHWTHPPFGADMDADGRIFARGAQDMKCVGMQYLGAIRALQAAGYQPRRTIYVSFVPDEEIGGTYGMKDYVHTEHFKQLRLGFALDEGVASKGDICPVFYAERTLWQLRLHISGNAGHGSLLLPGTAGEKLDYVVHKLMQLRQKELERLQQDSSIDMGDVTTVNLTQLKGGVLSNVVPALLEVTFDIRLARDVDIAVFEQQLRNWCAEAGGGIELEFMGARARGAATAVDDSNPYWVTFKRALDELGQRCRTYVIPGATDVRYVREAGIPALGFSPMPHTPILLHDHDEFLRADIYLRGIEVYKKLITALADTSF